MVHKFKLSGDTAEKMKQLISIFDDSRKLENDAKKAKDGAKDSIRALLLNERKCNVETLPEKDVVIVELDGTGLELKRKGSDRIGVQELRGSLPDIAKQFTTRTVSTYFETL